MKLPEIFKNKLNDTINNNEKTFISFSKQEENILDSLPVYVLLTTNDHKNYKTTIVGKTKNYIITNNRNIINIKDIKEIKKI